MQEDQSIKELDRIAQAIERVHQRRNTWKAKVEGVQNVLAEHAQYLRNHGPRHAPKPSLRKSGDVVFEFGLDRVDEGLMVRGAALSFDQQANGLVAVNYLPAVYRLASQDQEYDRTNQVLAAIEPETITQALIVQYVHAFLKLAADEHWAVKSMGIVSGDSQ